MKGSGTSSDPYLLFNESDMKQIPNNTTSHYVMQKDITLLDTWTPIMFAGVLDGQGFFLRNLTIVADGSDHYGLFSRMTGSGTVRNLNVETSDAGIQGDPGKYGGVIVGYFTDSAVIEYVTVRGLITSGQRLGGLIGYSKYGERVTQTATLCEVSAGGRNTEAVIGNSAHYTQNINDANIGNIFSSDLTRETNAGGGGIYAKDLTLDQLSYIPAYPTEMDFINHWEIEDGLPRIRQMQPAMAENYYKISGKVTIDEQPASRELKAYSYNETPHQINGQEVILSQSLGQSQSETLSGNYEIDLLPDYGDEVFVVAFDDQGKIYESDLVVSIGEKIRPTNPIGYVFEITQAGTLPSTEPAWDVQAETAVVYGTAEALAVPFYRPVVHGPVYPESANPPWTPANSPDISLWVDASWPTYVEKNANDEVTKWVDFSSNGFVFTQSGVSNLPYMTDFLGMKAPNFDGFNNSLLSDTNFTMPPDSWVITMLVNQTDTARKNYASGIFQVIGTNFQISYGEGNRRFDIRFPNGGRTETGYNEYNKYPKPPHILTIVKAVGQYISFRKNGVEIPTNYDSQSLAGSMDITGTFMLGLADSFRQEGWPGCIAEFIIEGGGANTFRAEFHEGYIAHKWGMQNILPNDHPYKKSFPRFQAPPVITSAEYWRLYVTASDDSGEAYNTMLQTLELWETDVIQLNTNDGTGVINSSSETAGYEAINVFNGSNDDWLNEVSQPQPQWVSYKFQAPKDVTKIVMQASGSNGFSRTPTTFEIQKSSDGVLWETVKLIENEPSWSKNEVRTYDLTV